MSRDELPTAAAAYALKRLGKYFHRWPDGRLQAWIAWFLHFGFGAVIVDRDEKIVGLALGRPTTMERANEQYAVDPLGNTMVCDLLIATNPAARDVAWHALCARVGPREWLAYRRLKYADRISVYPFARFNASVQKLPI